MSKIIRGAPVRLTFNSTPNNLVAFLDQSSLSVSGCYQGMSLVPAGNERVA